MSSTVQPEKSQQFFSPPWHGKARTPIVDGKYYDRITGNLLDGSRAEAYSGPPAVDLVIKSLHEDTSHCVYRAARDFSVETLLWQVMQVVHQYGLQIDSITATPYAIRVILAHGLTVDEFMAFAGEMVNGLGQQK